MAHQVALRQTYETDIPAQWELVKHIRADVGAKLSTYEPSVRSACVMVASELVENAMKYGESVATQNCAHLRMACTAESIIVEVTNGLPLPQRFAALRKHIEQISAAENVFDLYLKRLEELSQNYSGSAGLGLYRICLEGGCQLQCTYHNEVVNVTATRWLGGQT